MRESTNVASLLSKFPFSSKRNSLSLSFSLFVYANASELKWISVYRYFFFSFFSLFLSLSLDSVTKAFSIEFGWNGRRCQTSHGICAVDQDNELKFSKLFLAVWSKSWLECGWGRSGAVEHVYSTRFPDECRREIDFVYLKPLWGKGCRCWIKTRELILMYHYTATFPVFFIFFIFLREKHGSKGNIRLFHVKLKIDGCICWAWSLKVNF